VENIYILEGGREGWIKLRNEELYISGFSPNISRGIKSRRKRLGDQTVRTGEARNHLQI
jgi:hypothetical protein